MARSYVADDTAVQYAAARVGGRGQRALTARVVYVDHFVPRTTKAFAFILCSSL